MTSVEIWGETLKLAKLRQQEYYELLEEWILYEKHEYKYLRQNIGFAIFGPPVENEKSNVVLNKQDAVDNQDITQIFHYKTDAEKVIDTIYNKICTFGKQKNKAIYCGFIYNMMFHTKGTLVNKSISDKEREIELTPIFKIRPLSVRDEQIWYIDIDGRIYKSWKDYKENNTLPKCTMVLPKNGFYQANPNCIITEEYSTVWLEILDSPACSITSKLINGGDILSNVTGAVGTACLVASIFTAAAPVVLGASVASAASGIWSVSRSAFKLTDRWLHEETVTDRNAFGSWLIIATSAAGFAASRGNAYFSRLILNGSEINKITKYAYNALILSELGISGFGLGYQAYYMYAKYQEEQTVHVVDLAFLATHLLFFGNSVIDLHFADTLIHSTQGKILEDYRLTLRSKNLRKKFNRAKRQAKKNNVNTISQNAEVIRYINKKTDLNNISKAGNTFMKKKNLLYISGELIINGISFIDPMKFVDILIKFDYNSSAEQSFKKDQPLFSEENSDHKDMFFKLKDLLLLLLEMKSSHTKNTINIVKFAYILKDLSTMKNGTDILILIFNIADTVIAKSEVTSYYINRAIYFIWSYVKENLRRNFSKEISVDDEELEQHITRIVTLITEYLDRMVNKLALAFKEYINNRK